MYTFHFNSLSNIYICIYQFGSVEKDSWLKETEHKMNENCLFSPLAKQAGELAVDYLQTCAIFVRIGVVSQC